ncbi:ABC transporter substrate-binding protein [Roseospira visakhapatnamensis]|uniref:Putative ABC transport system substrate-binding protein n=1 Tax=Roseospira visakhapatnamensis TaxID=390880 RepID=A0A7W6RE28_9PROT|nr:ABC transporter substrate binding protein [Roseospira visakhapatnamensis]MBB4266859.1 putative ABC transport system substrate-binding protein [Roseospira visakhapatnamensis]
MKRLFLATCGLAALMTMATANPVWAVDVGVTWQGDSGMTNRVVAGFKERMAEVAPDVDLDIRGPLDDKAALRAAVDDFEANKDAMVVLRSNGSLLLTERPPGIPTLIGGGNHPPSLGVIQNMDAPEGNITGVTYFIPHDVPLQSYVTILPEATSMLLVVQEGHPGGLVDQAGTMEACDTLGLTCDVAFATSVETLRETISSKAEDYSAIVLGNTQLTMDEGAAAVDAAGDTPVFAYTGRPVEEGVLAGFVADDHKLGRMLADRLVQVVIDKTPIADIPVGTDDNPILYLNMTTAQRLGVEVPFQMLSTATVIE